jgi:hypothetical protein
MPKPRKRKLSRTKINELTGFENFAESFKRRRRLARHQDRLRAGVQVSKRIRENSKAVRKLETARARAFFREAERLKKQLMRTANITPSQRRLVTQKLAEIKSGRNVIFRLDSLGRAVQELSREDAFAGKGISIYDKNLGMENKWFDVSWQDSPERGAEYFFRSTAHQVTQ